MKSDTDKTDRRQVDEIIQSISRDREAGANAREAPEILLRKEQPGILSFRGP